MAALTEGAKAPAFSLNDQNGKTHTLADYAGKPVVLYFYPKDDTPGCTLEGREFTALLDGFRAAGVGVYGVSPDSPSSHERFAAKCELGVSLVSDPDHVLIEALGLWVEKSMYGRTYKGVERSTFLIGENGEVEREWRAVKAAGHASEVLEAVRPAV